MMGTPVHQAAEADRCQRGELRPLREQQHHMCAPGGIGQRARIAEAWADPPGVAEGGGVAKGDLRPKP
jgi:hypothetical protein